VFSGLNEEGMSGEHTGPSLAGAAGPSDYIEAADGRVTVYDSTDLGTIGSGSLADLAGAPTDQVYAPQIQWDAAAGRWLYAAVVNRRSGDFAFGWSKTPDPGDLSDDWCHFFVTASGSGPGVDGDDVLLPAGTVIALALRVHHHKLGPHRIRVGGGTTKLTLRLTNRRRRFVRRLAHARFKATLTFAVKLPGHPAATGRRHLHLRRSHASR
jgi:hypothetical protein